MLIYNYVDHCILGIYAEDDGKSVVGSVIYANGNPSRYGSRPGSVIVLNQNGGIYPEQQFLSNSSKNLLTTIPQDPSKYQSMLCEV